MEKFWECEHGILYQGDVNDCLQRLDTQVDMCITSPPYWAVRQYLGDFVQLRKDLSEEKKKEVLDELQKLGIIKVDE